MRKFLLIALVLLITGAVYGQRAAIESGKLLKAPQIEVTKSYDTLEPGNWANATAFYNYSIQQSNGYVAGTNSYGDIGKAQQFIVSNPYSIVGVAIWFGTKYLLSPDGEVNISVWDMDGTDGTTTAGVGDQQCPGTVLTTDAVSMALVDTADLHIHMFTTSYWLSGDYAIGIDMTDTKLDTISLVSSADGEGGMLELAWEQWSDNKWYSFLYDQGWAIDFDLGIFPIVDQSSGTIEHGSFINGLKLESYPNPAVDFVTVSYEIASASDVNIEIFSMNGQKVRDIKAGNQAAGVYDIGIDVTELSKGSYVYSVVAGGNRLSKIMVIE